MPRKDAVFHLPIFRVLMTPILSILQILSKVEQPGVCRAPGRCFQSDKPYGLGGTATPVTLERLAMCLLRACIALFISTALLMSSLSF